VNAVDCANIMFLKQKVLQYQIFIPAKPGAPVCKHSLLVCPNLLQSLTDQIILTAHEDLQFAEVCGVSCRIVELQNEISVRRHVALALQINRRARWNGARILATQVVVPHGRCCDSG